MRMRRPRVVERSAARTEEERIARGLGATVVGRLRRGGGREDGTCLLEVDRQGVAGRRAEHAQALLAPLAQDADLAMRQVDVAERGWRPAR